MNRKQIRLEYQNVLLRTMRGFMCIRLIGEFKIDEESLLKAKLKA